jgi:hypothetical protein
LTRNLDISACQNPRQEDHRFCLEGKVTAIGNGLDSDYTIHHPLHTNPQFLLYLKIPKPQQGPAFGQVVVVDFVVALPVPLDLGDQIATVEFDRGRKTLICPFY